mmetsp:Transcript_13845/g.28380  ORF Transcript_13845/g.28380 Transcript_13845/m.28380 type:complete len:215 (-) Transcript_13845:781-1425(-)
MVKKNQGKLERKERGEWREEVRGSWRGSTSRLSRCTVSRGIRLPRLVARPRGTRTTPTSTTSPTSSFTTTAATSSATARPSRAHCSSTSAPLWASRACRAACTRKCRKKAEGSLPLCRSSGACTRTAASSRTRCTRGNRTRSSKQQQPPPPLGSKAGGASCLRPFGLRCTSTTTGSRSASSVAATKKRAARHRNRRVLDLATRGQEVTALFWTR